MIRFQWTNLSEGALDAYPVRRWSLYSCRTCGGFILARGAPEDTDDSASIDALYPMPRKAAAELPERARTYLQQAFETLHAPDAAAVMAGSAVDAMLKEKGYTSGSVYLRIDEAVRNQVLTKEMGDWAHWVRLGANRPRHVDKDAPHVSPDEAAQAVDFAAALGEFLFVLTSKIKAGISDAEKASDPD